MDNQSIGNSIVGGVLLALGITFFGGVAIGALIVWVL